MPKRRYPVPVIGEVYAEKFLILGEGPRHKRSRTWVWECCICKQRRYKSASFMYYAKTAACRHCALSELKRTHERPKAGEMYLGRFYVCSDTPRKKGKNLSRQELCQACNRTRYCTTYSMHTAVNAECPSCLRRTGILASLTRKWKDTVQGARIRNLEVLITRDEAYSLYQSPCRYCGGFSTHTNETTREQFKLNGIDRDDSSVGYTQANCYPCCWLCNRAKSTLLHEEFLAHVKKIMDHQTKHVDTK